jgi:inhibitor of KinA sporulation pathway (predicted exonuclease)
MKYIALDLEMNQPSGKIIQIGYVIFNPLRTDSYIKKCLDIKIDEPITEYITDLTGITQDQNDRGISMKVAMEVMKKDVADRNVRLHVLEWGSGDSYTLAQQSGLSLFKSPVNVKALYQTYGLYTGTNVVAGLAKSMKYLGLEFKGRTHNAMDDAYNTAIVFQHIGGLLKRAHAVEKIYGR